MRKIKTIGIIAAAAVLLAAVTGATALAVHSGGDRNGPKLQTTCSMSGNENCKPAGRGTMGLDKLVTAGTITQDQATVVENALKTAMTSGQKCDLKTVLDGLVTANTITADQETAILNSMKPQGQMDGGKMMNGFLDKLVTAGTITQDQATAVENALKTAMTSGQKVDVKTVLDNLVTAGTITADQETAIINAMTPQHTNNNGMMGGQRGMMGGKHFSA